MSPPLARRLPAPVQRGEAAARLSRLALGAALGLLSMACVQLGSAWSVPAMRELGPFSLTWLRLSCAAVLLGALVRPPLRELARGHRGLILGLGGAMAGMMLCFFAALRSMPLGLTVAINFLGPLLVAVVGARRRLDLAWPLLALLGVLLLARHQGQWQADAAGLAFAAAAAACWGGYIVLMKRAGQVFRGLDGLTAALLAAALLSAPFGLAGHALPSPRQLAAVAELALLMPLLPYVLEISALRLMPAASFGILSSAEPAIAALAGYLLLAQAIAPAQMLGVLLVVAASLGALTLA